MSDKPGMTSLEQLAELRKVQAETGRIYSVCYSEHYDTRSTVEAGRLVRAGAIGRVVQTLGLGPHRPNPPSRPAWFFQKERYGGILTDIASHQIDQFLWFTGATSAEVVASTVGNFANPDTPGLQDFGEVLLRSDEAQGYIRVDWYTPQGLPTWGDGRLLILGTAGYMELRKYVDIAGREGKDHLFVVDDDGTEHIDASDAELSYYPDLLHDVRHRTQRAAPQEHTFETMRLALEAQRQATRRGGSR